MASNALALLEGDTLRLRGVLDRAAVIALWPQLQSLPAQLARLELSEVERVDSAGLALLAELAARAGKAGHPLAISGAPAGYNELSAAYRLSPDLDFNATSAAS
ncbi:TPA: STAS domain-containing protein [Stenotrophomonas maltophilia]|uniref:STAS domain-containing protein n=1 Tax=Stenotrophomonas TaxID=40323 RepID=UPI001AA1270C|nr:MULTISPECIES: STAS domain-containing protein [Stenotrophomonas]ELF4108218.1 STAS domain-containing protein [Stenotrophomonas maltophilia]MBO1745844.1 STAS domain-containing protein [Stenotrophomonas maltophilia]MCU1173139.1 STAS domain-containing protein [Stenotrophomonas maltophilia]WAP01933.1 STAS domain-containing protein [Stenotrophomonas sp. SBJS02]HEA4091859.1 STAS domain-containing protein [Stenotrophomonas maltophilia]